MSNTTKVILAVLGILVFIPLIMLATVNNACVSYEADIKAQEKVNLNTYDSFWKQVKEVAQVTKQYAGDQKELYKTVMTGRYGQDGSKAMWQWLKESNPTLDSSMYQEIQRVIQSGRRDFKVGQDTMADKIRVYEVYTGKFPNNLLVRLAGYPVINLEDYRPITSEETEDAAKTRKAGAVNVF